MRKNKLKPIFEFCLINKKLFTVGFFLTVLSSLTQVVVIYIFKYMLDNLSVIEINRVLQLGLLLMLIIITYVVINKIITKIMSNIKQTSLQVVHKKLYRKIEDGNYLDIQKTGEGDWTMFYSEDSEVVSDIFTRTIFGIVKGLSTFLFSLVLIISISPLLTFTVLILAFSASKLPNIFVDRLKQSKNDNLDDDSVIKKFTLDIVDNIKYVKSSYNNVFFINKFKELYQVYIESKINNTKEQAVMMIFSIGTGMISQTVWLIIALLMVYNGNLKISSIFVFMAMSESLSWVFNEYPYYKNDLVEQYLSYDRLKQFFKINNCEKHTDFIPLDSNTLISLDNISFIYPKSNKSILNKFSLVVNKGDKIVIGGPSGGGKSTLLNLILGELNPTNGKIYINDTLVDKYDNNKLFSISYQEAMLFAGTIRENLLVGVDTKLSDQEIDEVLIKSDLKEFIDQLPNGLDTRIGKGQDTNISIGQMQRLSFARALVSEAEILLLDEVTSSLDSASEAVILESLMNSDKTIIMIAHRENVLYYKGMKNVILT